MLKPIHWTRFFILEIKRTSITRLKLAQQTTHRKACLSWNQKNLDYEIETYPVSCMCGDFPFNLKSKEPRLRDWNLCTSGHLWVSRLSWNQKNLDYEIETCCGICKATSVAGLKSKEPRLRDWNLCMLWLGQGLYCLEIKRTSITRLKLGEYAYRILQFYLLEIKRTSITRLKLFTLQPSQRLLAWNQKNLDYEIETYRRRFLCQANLIHLKSKEPRLRDWNVVK